MEGHIAFVKLEFPASFYPKSAVKLLNVKTLFVHRDTQFQNNASTYPKQLWIDTDFALISVNYRISDTLIYWELQGTLQFSSY